MDVGQLAYSSGCHLLKAVCQLLRLPPRASCTAFYFLHAYHELEDASYRSQVEPKVSVEFSLLGCLLVWSGLITDVVRQACPAGQGWDGGSLPCRRSPQRVYCWHPKWRR